MALPRVASEPRAESKASTLLLTLNRPKNLTTTHLLYHPNVVIFIRRLVTAGVVAGVAGGAVVVAVVADVETRSLSSGHHTPLCVPLSISTPHSFHSSLLSTYLLSKQSYFLTHHAYTISVVPPTVDIVITT
jgi:hypothetical protein